MDDLVKALRSGEQADMDGILVKVSRQACEEAADAIEALQARVAEKGAEVARLKAERDEALRRRDEWRAKAEGYDAVRLALREKVGTPWPPHMSRLLWAGIAADEKKRADDAASEVARLRAALDAAAIRAMKGERE